MKNSQTKTNNKTGKGRNSKPGNNSGHKSNANPKSRFSNKDKDNGGNCDPKFTDEKGTNDPMWYAKNPELLRTAASYPFAWSAGLPIPAFSTANPGAYGKNIYVPGIAAMHLVPTIPNTTNPQDSVNIAIWELYTALRHTLTATLPYDVPELFCMLTAISNVYSYINYLRRAYGVCYLWVNENRYVPQTILRAMGIDPAIASNMADFNNAINLLTTKVASFTVPANITYFARQAMLYSNVYTSGTSIKDQLYMYVPEGFFRYTETTATGAGLEYVQFMPFESSANAVTTTKDEDLMSLEQLLDFGNTLLQPLLSSQDISSISTNILKAVGSDKVLKLTTLPLEFTIAPIFDIGVLEQMSNAEILPYSTFQYLNSKNTLDVTQALDNSDPAMWINYTPQYDTSETTGAITSTFRPDMQQKLIRYHFVNTTTQYTDPGLIVESTRLKWAATLNADNDKVYDLHFATEVPVAFNVWGIAPSTDAQSPIRFDTVRWGMIRDTLTIIGGDSKGSVDSAEARWLKYLISFRFRPQAWLSRYTAGTRLEVESSVPYFDIDNYAVMTNDELIKLNEVAVYSLFQA